MNLKNTDMNTREIFALLDKYYMGESSDIEERLLRKYFSEGSVPPELENEREIFKYYSTSSKAPAPSTDFEKRIISAIDKSLKAEPEFYIKRKLYAVISSAAVVLLLLGSYFLFAVKSHSADTFSDPALAYAETLKILYTVSSGLNSGIDALEPVRKLESTAVKSMGTISRSAGMIESNLRPLGYFQKAIDMANSPLETITK